MLYTVHKRPNNNTTSAYFVPILNADNERLPPVALRTGESLVPVAIAGHQQ